MADLEAAKPAMIDTVYGVASISKWLAAATVLKLVEAGKLSLDAPITTWTCSPTSCLGRSRRPRRPAPVSGGARTRYPGDEIGVIT